MENLALSEETREYDALCKRYEEDLKALAKACDEWKKNPSKELRDKCELLGGTVSDDRWEMQRRFPDRMEAHYMFC